MNRQNAARWYFSIVHPLGATKTVHSIHPCRSSFVLCALHPSFTAVNITHFIPPTQQPIHLTPTDFIDMLQKNIKLTKKLLYEVNLVLLLCTLKRSLTAIHQQSPTESRRRKFLPSMMKCSEKSEAHKLRRCTQQTHFKLWHSPAVLSPVPELTDKPHFPTTPHMTPSNRKTVSDASKWNAIKTYTRQKSQTVNAIFPGATNECRFSIMAVLYIQRSTFHPKDMLSLIPILHTYIRPQQHSPATQIHSPHSHYHTISTMLFKVILSWM